MGGSQPLPVPGEQRAWSHLSAGSIPAPCGDPPVPFAVPGARKHRAKSEGHGAAGAAGLLGARYGLTSLVKHGIG